MYIDLYHYPNQAAVTFEDVNTIAAEAYDAVSIPLFVPLGRSEIASTEAHINSRLGREYASEVMASKAAPERDGVHLCESGNMMYTVIEPTIVPAPESYAPTGLPIIDQQFYSAKPVITVAKGLIKNVPLIHQLRAALPLSNKLQFNAISSDEPYANIAAYTDEARYNAGVALHYFAMPPDEWQQQYAHLTALKVTNLEARTMFMRDELLSRLSFMALTQEVGRLAIIDLYGEDASWTRNINHELYSNIDAIDDVKLRVRRPVEATTERPAEQLANVWLSSVHQLGTLALPELIQSTDKAVFAKHMTAYLIAVMCEHEMPDFSSFDNTLDSAFAEIDLRPSLVGDLLGLYYDAASSKDDLDAFKIAQLAEQFSDLRC